MDRGERPSQQMQAFVMAACAAAWVLEYGRRSVGVISYNKIDVTLKEPKVGDSLWLPSLFGKSPHRNLKKGGKKISSKSPIPGGIL